MEDIGYRVIPYELPGHGGNSALPVSDDDTVATMLAIAQREGITSAVGFSAGTMLLLRAAVQKPDVFRRLVLIGIGDQMWEDPKDFSRLADDLLSTKTDPALDLLRKLTIRAGNSIESVASYARSVPPPPSLPILEGLDAEVLILLGDEDFVRPVDRLLSALPNASLVTLAKTDHYRAPSSPNAMKATIDFFAR